MMTALPPAVSNPGVASSTTGEPPLPPRDRTGGRGHFIWLTERVTLAGDDWLLHGRFDRDGVLLECQLSAVTGDLARVFALPTDALQRFAAAFLSACRAMAERDAETARWAIRCRQEAGL